MCVCTQVVWGLVVGLKKFWVSPSTPTNVSAKLLSVEAFSYVPTVLRAGEYVGEQLACS